MPIECMNNTSPDVCVCALYFITSRYESSFSATANRVPYVSWGNSIVGHTTDLYRARSERRAASQCAQKLPLK